MEVAFLEVHGPHASSPDVSPEIFWKDVDSALRFSAAHRRRPILLADANARMGSVITEAAGGLDPEQQTNVSGCFHQVLLDHQLWLPSTWHGFHKGPSGTWLSHTQQWHRLDYIALPLFFRMWDVSTEVVYAFDMLSKKDDHVPVAAHVRGAVERGAPQRLLRSFRKLDASQFQTSPAVDDYVNAMQRVDQAPWEMGRNAHAETLMSAFRKSAEDHLPQTIKRPRKSFLSRPTWQAICERSNLMKYVRELDRFGRRSLLRVCLRVWCVSDQVALDRYLVRYSVRQAELWLMRSWALQRRKQIHPLARTVCWGTAALIPFPVKTIGMCCVPCLLSGPRSSALLPRPLQSMLTPHLS